MENPYQRPSANVATRESPNDALDDIVSGQKLAIYAILLYIVVGGMTAASPQNLLSAPLMLVCLGLSWTGIYRIGRGLGYPLWWRIVLLALMLAPLLGLLVLASLSSRATSRLRKAGYSVGLLGARNY